LFADNGNFDDIGDPCLWLTLAVGLLEKGHCYCIVMSTMTYRVGARSNLIRSR